MNRAAPIVTPEPADDRGSGASEVTVAEALQLAVQYHRNGHLKAAETVYRRVLEASPDQPDALHFLGVLAHQQGDSAKAIELIRRAIALLPESAGLYNNLGNVLYEAEQFDEAACAYESAIRCEPRHADAFSNLGAVRRIQGRLAEAAEAYRRAIEIDPRHADAHHNLGNLLSAQGRVQESVTYYCTAITLRPEHPEARRHLGIAYATLGRMAEAADVYRKWLREEPGNPVATHMLAACCGESTPDRASDLYVEQIFDNFARSFDAKLARLSYRAPQLVAEAVRSAYDGPAGRLAILDAGCGTGLCAPLVAPFAGRLVGVDLSSAMLLKASSRDAYDELVKCELTEYMVGHPAEFDLVISADTLVYFGALDAAFDAAYAALRSDGILVFTVEHAREESTGSPGYRLNPHGRYSHTESYLMRALGASGFRVAHMSAATLRMESGTPVAGTVVTARKPAPAAVGAGGA
ncbi:MAG TPA: tetratricopeptide repeat protein [Steroidobacteraceae bacterium]|nr:tetratricopeptide repeat protein [Steroidobacteraceae bacterium]